MKTLKFPLGLWHTDSELPLNQKLNMKVHVMFLFRRLISIFFARGLTRSNQPHQTEIK